MAPVRDVLDAFCKPIVFCLSVQNRNVEPLSCGCRIRLYIFRNDRPFSMPFISSVGIDLNVTFLPPPSPFEEKVNSILRSFCGVATCKCISSYIIQGNAKKARSPCL